MAGGSVDFGVPAERAYDYLVDPTLRPQWQSSLRAVDVVKTEPVVGLVWTDVTWPGLRPRMELTLADRPNAWREHGRWRAFSADLTLTFTPTDTGCRVVADFEIRAAGLLAPLGPVLTTLGRRPVLADLRRAAGILSPV